MGLSKEEIDKKVKLILQALSEEEKCNHIKIRKAFLDGVFFGISHPEIANQMTVDEFKKMIDL
jgi:hypothetical protein